jgi:ribosomal protein S17E
MKKLLGLATAAMFALSVASVPAFAGDGITVIVNGETIDFTGDQEPVIKDGRTLVPFRAVFEKMGAQVEWFDGYFEAMYGEFCVGMNVGETKVSLGDGQEIESDVPAQIIGGRAMVPLRIISESIGADVNWDSATKTITVKTPEIKGQSPTSVTYETKTGSVTGKVSKINYSYPVVTDVFTAVDILNKNIENDVVGAVTSIADENASGDAELTVTYDIKLNSSGLFSVMYLINDEEVALFHYGISNGAAFSQEGFEQAVYGGTPSSNDTRYDIGEYSNALRSDDDVTCLISADVYYPQFTGDADFISSLNTQLENSAKKAADSFVESYKDEAAKRYESNKSDISSYYLYVESFDVEISDDNVATITTQFKEDVYGKDEREGESVIKIDLNTGEVLE